jgi:hypothetical protein
MEGKEKQRLITEIVEGLQNCDIDTYLEKKLCLKAAAADSIRLTDFLNKIFSFVENRQPKLLPMKKKEGE